MTTPTLNDIQAFYTAAHTGLRALDTREGRGRRFGADADLRWRDFQGHLNSAHRLDLLVRDAAASWGAAFSPAAVFRLPGLAEDEAFGPDWEGLAAYQAEELFRTTGAHDIGAAAAALGIDGAPVQLPELTASTKLIVAGGAAVLAAGRAFARRPELSWSDQVIVMADRPANRQLAGLVAPMVGATAATRLLDSGAERPAYGEQVVTQDAEAAVLQKLLGGEWGEDR